MSEFVNNALLGGGVRGTTKPLLAFLVLVLILVVVVAVGVEVGVGGGAW